MVPCEQGCRIVFGYMFHFLFSQFAFSVEGGGLSSASRKESREGERQTVASVERCAVEPRPCGHLDLLIT